MSCVFGPVPSRRLGRSLEMKERTIDLGGAWWPLTPQRRDSSRTEAVAGAPSPRGIALERR
jgi:hypothetical protein